MPIPCPNPPPFMTNVSPDLFIVKNALGIEELPASLREAITEFQKDQFMQEVLGEELSQKLIESKRAEYRAYRTQVTEWEINEYLQKF